MQKRAHVYFRNPCALCDEARRFLDENGVMTVTRDIGENPLRRDELADILGYHDPRYYLDSLSPNFKKQKLDQNFPPRQKLFEIIEENPDLLKHPIIVSGRLMTIGSNRRQLIEMLQLSVSDNGSGHPENGDKNGEK